MGISLRPRHPDALVYTSVRAPDKRTFDIFHAIIKAKAFDFIDAARAKGAHAHAGSRAAYPFMQFDME